MKILAVLLALASVLSAQPRIPVIIDTDIGDDIDDALALAFALQSPELDVRAVTTVIDNVDDRTRLAWKELGVYGRRDVPLAMGAPEPLLDPVRVIEAAQFRILTSADTIPAAARRPAVALILDTLRNSREKITLVALGPLTNLALALKTDPSLKPRIERIVLMGGAYASGQSEYNIRRDRLAAQIVFQSGVPITAVGLDVTMKCKTGPRELDRLRAAGDPRSHFLLRLLELWKSHTTQEYPVLHDPLAVAAVFRPKLIETAAGQVTVVDGVTKFAEQAGGTTSVARGVDAAAFLDLFASRVSGQ